MDQFLKNLEHVRRLHSRGGPGRPREASDEIRANNYRNVEGRYAMVAGLKPWHERIVDFMLLHPNATVKKIADEFQVTPQWIGTLMKSDAFQEYYQSRMAAHQNLVSNEIIGKMQSVAVKAAGKLEEKLVSADLPVAEIREIAKLSLSALGYSSGPGVKVQINNNNGGQMVVGADPGLLAKARQEMEAQRQKNSESITQGTDYQYVTAALQVKKDAEDAIEVTPALPSPEGF